jgi:hypothetical protein
MGLWLLYAEGEDTRSVQDDVVPVAEWLADHRGVYCVRHEGDAFRCDYRPLPGVDNDGQRQPPRAVFLQRERDAKLFRDRPTAFEDDAPEPGDQRYDILEGRTRISIVRVLHAIEREYGTFTLPNAVRRPPRPVL